MVHKMKRDALDQFRADYQAWATIAPYAEKGTRPPKIPSILRERPDA